MTASVLITVLEPGNALDPMEVYVGNWTDPADVNWEVGTIFNPFPTIVAALESSRVNGDATINVAAGTYTEQLVMKEAHSLVGDGVGLVTIQAPSSMDVGTNEAYSIIEVADGADVSITGVTVNAAMTVDCDANPGLGITVIGDASLELTDSAIVNVGTATGSYCSRAYGLNIGDVYGGGAGEASINNVSIALATSGKNGIWVEGVDSEFSADGLTITASDTTTGQPAQNGIILSSGAANIRNADISGFNYISTDPDPEKDWNALGLIYYGGKLTLSDSTFSDNKSAISFEGGTGTVVLTNNAFSGNRWTIINRATGLTVDFGSNSINGVTADASTPVADMFVLEQNTFHRLDGPTIFGPVIFVPGNHYVVNTTNLSNAVADAAANDFIHVRQGSYDLTSHILLDTAGVELLGSNSAVVSTDTRNQETRITGGGFRVAAADVTVAGFEFIEPGTYLSETTPFYLQVGTANLEIKNNIVTGSEGTSRGVINATGATASATISGNTFGNLTAGVFANPGATFTITGNLFDDNTAGSANDAGGGVIIGNTFRDNTEGIGLAGDDITVADNMFEAGNTVYVERYAGNSDLKEIRDNNTFPDGAAVVGSRIE